MKRQKIGVMTFWESQENYGQLLQATALQIFLERNGNDAFLIKYDKSKAVKKKRPDLSARIRDIGWNKLLQASAVKRKFNSFFGGLAKPDRHFDSFKDDFLKFSAQSYNSIDELKASPPVADVYITGSDQVWNHNYTVDSEPFFLQFGPASTRRMSYAASFGHSTLPTELKKKYREYLKGFDGISVRESSGVELCKQMGFDETQLVPDPTFLLDKTEWSAYGREDKQFSTGKKTKVFVYTIGNRSSATMDELISYVSALPDVEVSHVSINKDFSGKRFPSIPEWLGYYQQADLVITNSFHGMVFSTIFNKNFIGIPSAGDKAGMNDRLTTFLEKLGLENYLLGQFDKEQVDGMLSRKEDWGKVNSKVKEWRKQAETFLNFERVLA